MNFDASQLVPPIMLCVSPTRLWSFGNILQDTNFISIQGEESASFIGLAPRLFMRVKREKITRYRLSQLYCNARETYF